MKLSVSLSADDVAIVDAYAAAWDEWVSSGEHEVWERSTGDGVSDAAR